MWPEILFNQGSCRTRVRTRNYLHNGKKIFSNNIFMNLTSIFTSSLRHERGTEYTCRGGHKTNVSLRLHSYKFLGRYVLRLSLEHPYFSLTIPLRSPSYKQYSSHTRKRSVTYLNALKPQLIVFIRLVGG